MKRIDRKEENRVKILTAAEALIRESGSTDFTMAELSRQCRLSIATIYNLMTSKSSVLYALLNASLDKVIAAPVSGGDPIEGALKASEMAGQIFTSDPELFKPLYRYLLGVPDPVHRPAFMARALSYWTAQLTGLEEGKLLPRGLGLIEFARDHQLFFAGVLDLWVQGELTDDAFRAQVNHGGIVRLLAVASASQRKRLLPALAQLAMPVRAAAT